MKIKEHPSIMRLRMLFRPISPIIKQMKRRITERFFHRKTLVSQKKALPLPRFLRDDNIMSNLLIKTNLSINN